jgi:hypothetical protein
MKEHTVSIWFLIGLQLAIYGALVTGAGIYQYITPPAHPLVLAELHAGIWWGALMGVLGAFYIVKFRPHPETLTAAD